MRTSERSVYIRFLVLFCIAYYLCISLGVEFAHNHEPDAEFHNDCPACQWQLFYMDDFSEAQQITGALTTPLRLIGYNRHVQSFVFSLNIFTNYNSSRAPPSLCEAHHHQAISFI